MKQIIQKARAVGYLMLFFTVSLTPASLTAQTPVQPELAKLSKLSKTPKMFYKSDVNLRINLDILNLNIDQALKIIAKKANLKLTYRGDIMVDKKVTLNARNIKVNKALDQILEVVPLDYRFSRDRYLLIIPKSTSLKKASDFMVQGTVLDAINNETLPGVNILVKGEDIGTATDAEGHYQLSVPSPNDTLVFSFLGYQTQAVPINGRKTINISLQSKTLTGHELVVVGYGTQKKQNVTGAISSVSSKELQDQPAATNLQGALEGKTAGVQITQNSGQPGSNAMVRIRGITSINNSSPLYVVDGVPLASNNINVVDPNNIASIQILKDASAEAIYGSRGANGVVLIKTKQGSKNNSKITVNASGGIQQVAKKIPLANSPTYVKLVNESFNNAGLESPIKKPPSAFNSTTDWQDAVFRLAPTQNYNIAFSGGSQNLTYRASGGYVSQEGVIKYSDYDRLSFRLNSTFHPRSSIEIGENLTVKKSKSYNQVHRSSQCCNVITSTLRMEPTLPVYDKNGDFNHPVYSNDLPPLAQLKYQTANNPLSDWDVVGGTHLQYEPIKGLSLKSQLSVDLNFGDNTDFEPTYNTAPDFYNLNQSISHTKSEAFNWIWDNTVTYETDLNRNNHIKVLGGISQEKYTYDYVTGSNQGQPGNESYLRYLNAGISSPTVAGQQYQWALLSYFGRINYNFKQTYFLTATIRRDGSSKFGPGDKYGNFPSASAGWVLTNESFFPQNSILNYLKLRGSWGITGNQSSLGYYDYASNIVNYYYPFGKPGAAETTSEPGGLGNQNLHWEQVDQWNIGLDYHLLNDRLTGSIEYYHKKTKDMLLSLPLLSESGFTTGPRSNVGAMVNSGVEFTADYQRNFNQNLNLDVGGHFSTLHNEVTSLQQPGEKIYSAGYKQWNVDITEVGQRIASFYGYVQEGLFQNWDQVYNHATQNQDPNKGRNSQIAENYTAPGDIKYKDINDDGVINDKDRTILGTSIPKVTYGFHVGGNYKGFDWNISFDGVYGNKIYQSYKYYLDELYTYGYEVGQELVNRWHGPGTSNYIPRLNANDPNSNTRPSSFFLKDGSYLRVRNLVLGYSLPQTLLPQANVQKIRVYISVQNLFTFTKYNGYTPEIGEAYSGTSGTLDLGLDPSTYPQSRAFSIGVNFTF